MRPSRLAAAALALSLPVLSLSVAAQTPLKPRPVEPPKPAASELPITRVALYKNGVGFFEHAGKVSGDQSVTIDFTSAQLNDVLQSLTAVDLNGGRISGAGYNSTTPLDEQLKTLPLALNADPTDVDFFNAIRGARVQLTAPGASFAGRLLSIDTRATNTPDHRFVTVVGDTGQVKTVELTGNVSVTLLDTALHTDVTRYLELLAGTRNQGLRHLTLLDRGTGARDLRVSYISEVPVWKSTYRILFTDAKQATDSTATLQGWSVVDNTTGSDWTNIHLDLIAGAPQSFIQPLSIPYYTRRPEIALPSEAQLAPQTHDSGELAGSGGSSVRGIVTDQSGAVIPNATVVAINSATGERSIRQSSSDGTFSVPVGQPGQYNLQITSPGFQSYNITGVNVSTSPRTIMRAQLQVGSASQSVTVMAAPLSLQTESAAMSVRALPSRKVSLGSSRAVLGGAPGEALSPSAAPIDYAQAAEASIAPQTSASAFDDFFQYSLTDPITIRKNESAMVPILQTKLPIERVTLWSASHPVALRALWLTNSSTLTLDRGSFSIVENGSFGGEGLLDPIHPGEKRLLSYAADQAVHVDNATGPQQHKLRSVVIAKGILTQQYRDVVQRDYTLRNAAPESRTVILEHTRTPGFDLQPSDTKPDETTPGTYRYRVSVAGGTTVHLKIAESRAYPRTIDIGTINDQQVRVLVLEMGSDPAIGKQLQPVLDAQRAVADLDAKDTALGDKLDNLDKEEERQRNNIVALKDADKLSQKRFVDQLGKIEDQILEAQKQQEVLNTQLEAARADLANKVQAVQFTQTLEP